METILSSFNYMLSQRIRNPIWGTLFLSWSIWNFRFYLILLYSDGYKELNNNLNTLTIHYETTRTYISSIFNYQLFPTELYSNGLVNNVFLPILSTLIILLIVQPLLLKPYKKIKMIEQSYINAKNSFSDTSLSAEAAKLLINRLTVKENQLLQLNSDLENDYRSKEERFNEETELLKKENDLKIRETKNLRDEEILELQNSLRNLKDFIINIKDTYIINLNPTLQILLEKMNNIDVISPNKLIEQMSDEVRKDYFSSEQDIKQAFSNLLNQGFICHSNPLQEKGQDRSNWRECQFRFTERGKVIFQANRSAVNYEIIENKNSHSLSRKIIEI